MGQLCAKNFSFTEFIFVSSACSVGYQPFGSHLVLKGILHAQRIIQCRLNVSCTFWVEDSMVPCKTRSQMPFSKGRMFSIRFLSSIFGSPFLIKAGHKALENFAGAYAPLLNTGFQFGILNLTCSFLAFGLKVFFMTQCVFYVQQLFCCLVSCLPSCIVLLYSVILFRNMHCKISQFQILTSWFPSFQVILLSSVRNA